MLLPALNRPGIRVIRSIFSLAIVLSPAMLFGQGDPVPNYVVNTTADDATGTASNCASSPEGICTLRDALAAAGAVSASNITFDPTVFFASNSAAANTITLANGTLNIPSGTTVTGLAKGSGATLTNLVTVSTGPLHTTIFTVISGVTGAVIANLNITGGGSGGVGGGGVYNEGELTVTGSTFSGNIAGNYGGGGAIYNTGELTVIGSTFSDNAATFGGAINTEGGTLMVADSIFSGNQAGGAIGGAIYADGGTLTVADSTFSGNFAGAGGAIAVGNSTFTLNNSTISDNMVAGIGGGGIYGGGDTLNITNSIVEGNVVGTGGSNADIDIVSSTVNDLGGNLMNTSASLTVVNPNLTPLGNYGGLTQTMLPQPGSAAICGGIASNIPAGVTTDQRGYPIENTTYPGYSASTPCVDSGAVQTHYALAFTTQPPASATFNEAISPAPVVTQTESGNLASAATGKVRMTDSSNVLSGTTSEGLSSGSATFPGLILDLVATDDVFTAWLGLNPMLNISAQASVGVTTPAPDLAIMQSPKPGTATILGTSNIPFQWSTGTGVTSYKLYIGTNGAGSTNILNTGVLKATTYTLSRLPADGVTLFVRLGSLINGAWQNEDYIYTESGSAISATLSPSSGTLSPNQLFTWGNGNDATNYQLVVRSEATGSPVLINTGVTTETSATVTVPANGATVVATLYQFVDGLWQHTAYTFIAPLSIPVVNTAADDATGTASNCTSSPEGTCTLRDALAAASQAAPGYITFDPTVFLATNSAAANTITLGNGPLSMSSNTTIAGLTGGSGATLTNLVTVSGNNATGVLWIVSCATGAVIANLNITEGNSSGGGGVDNAGQLAVIGSTFSGNSSSGLGGAIYSFSSPNNGYCTQLTVTGSTFSGNSAVIGGAIFSSGLMLPVTGSTFNGNSASSNGGAIRSEDGVLTVTGSTFSGNSSGGGGGAIDTYESVLKIENSTVSGNSVNYGVSGGGIEVLGEGTLNIANSIVEGNTVGSEGSYPDIGLVSGTLNDLGGNLINTSASPTVVNPNLTPLGNYGGPTQTMLPLPGSKAICGGVAANIPAGVTTDQRGYPIENTTYPGYSSSTPCVDSGAVQTNYALDFATQPPANATYEVAIAPAPVVTLTESGNLAGKATGMVTMTDSAGVLSGTTSEGLSSGAATFPGLELAGAVTNDIFTTWLGLNPMLNISAQASVGVTVPPPTGPAPAIMLSPSPGTATVLGTSNILFHWSSGYVVTSYQLLIGTSGVGSSNILATAPLTTTSYTVPALPNNGDTLYVRLGSLINGAWQTEDYRYTESGIKAPSMLSPTPGTATILGTSNVTFTWVPGAPAAAYDLWLGTTGVGSGNVYHSGFITTTSATAPKLPYGLATDTVYVRLWYLIDGTWQSIDYTYSATPSVAPALTGPTPGTQLGTSNVNFTWTPGTGATLYDFWVGTTGVGSHNVYVAGHITTTSATAPKVPYGLSTDTLYVRLWYLVNGTWQYTDYTYSATPPAAPALTTPTPGSVLGTSNVTFTWTAGTGPTLYDFWLSNNGVGTDDLYVSGRTTATSVTAPKVPAHGATIYVRLWYLIDDTWHSTDYTYTEQ